MPQGDAIGVPLTDAFDGGRKVFEKRSEIRRAVREKIRAEARRQGRNDAVDALLRYAVRDEATGHLIVVITPEVLAAMRSKPDESAFRDFLMMVKFLFK